MAECVLTLDAGTGSGRAIAFDLHGTVLASAQEPFVYRVFDDPAFPMVRGVDLDPAAFWGVLARCARTVVAGLAPGTRIRAVVPTSQREGCVFTDGSGAVLYAGPNLDARSIGQGLELEQRLGGAYLHAVTGHGPPYIFALARWCWYRRQGRPEQVASLFMLNDWMVYRLSGARLAEHASASESMLYDVGARAWSRALCEAVALPPDVLPPVVDAGTVAGGVQARAAEETGIPAGTPVVVGGPDTGLALLGSGVLAPDEAGVVLGTTAPVQVIQEHPRLDAAASLWTSAHVVPGQWVLESNGGDTGGAYRWLLELLFGASDGAAHAAAETAMAGVGPDPRPMVSHLGPVVFDLRRMNPFSAAGLLFRFPISYLDRPGRGEILRAFLESIAFAARGNVEQLVAVTGRPLRRLALSGGMTRVAVLPRLVATALGRPVEVAAVPESAGLGCAMVGAVASGAHASYAEASAAMVRTSTVEPDRDRVEAFAAHYGVWREKVAWLQAAVL